MWPARIRNSTSTGMCCSCRCGGLRARALKGEVSITTTCSNPSCGKTIVINKNRAEKSSTGRLYCSKKCNRNDPFVIERQRIKMIEATQHLRDCRVEVTCSSPGCTEKMEIIPARIKRTRHFYCKVHAHRGHIRTEEQREKLRKYCLKNNTVAALQKKWADPEFKEAFYKNRRGPNHPAWKGGSSLKGYDEEFMRVVRYSTKHRDGYCCRLCHVKKVQSELHSHHIDQDKDNSDPQNIITLCRKCHGKVHRKSDHQSWQRVLRDLMSLCS